MDISELEKVVRETAGNKDLHSIEESTLSTEIAEATRTLSQRKNKKRAAAISLLNPSIGIWY